MDEDNKLDLKALNVYLVEGVVEVDPLDNTITIRTVDQKGQPFSFDPLPVLNRFKGQEVRLILTPLSSITTLEDYVKTLDSPDAPVVLGEPRKSDAN